ncbi:Septum-promoting GTP-binding protein 1 [Camellia lanceoleosa]|nr:Septum-promoting GTP-binding protein 1 [Camellia lanceoleosa]
MSVVVVVVVLIRLYCLQQATDIAAANNGCSYGGSGLSLEVEVEFPNNLLGDDRSLDQIPIACKDAVAILFMFDLTIRCTLNIVIGWYNQARKWNQTTIPILIGTKFDDFVQLLPDLQWTIVTQVQIPQHFLCIICSAVLIDKEICLFEIMKLIN